MKRLSPQELLAAARVCKGWRDTSRRIWKAAEELRLKVPAKSQPGFAGSVVRKCPGLLRLSLRIESDVEATMLACIAFSCPNLQSLEICMSDSSVNRITGDELGRFVADRRCLSSLKMEGCCNLGGFNIFSSSLSTLWISNLHSLTKMVFNCPNLKEISLDFSRQENECTDLVTAVDGLGRSCPRLQNIHIASTQLSHAVVLSLTAADLRGLRMLSLVLGTEITDASVAAIASSYANLELLDLSGSSISDSGIGMICNAFPNTLSRLLLALCPNITSSGIQFATAQLPRLELMDCGMTICDLNEHNLASEEDSSYELQKTSNSKLHLMYQKLIIKHDQLKKLSLWGCSGLDALYLNCPKLNDLNLNSCYNLLPESLLIQCPNLENVHASGCQNMVVQSIQNQVSNDFGASRNKQPFKRLADGSKRVQVPHFLDQQFSSPTEIMTCVRSIREIFHTMDDGETTVSPYDTAWVALVEDINKPGNPQFPSSLEWIVDNQLSDGSWGDHKLFLAHDRILNTLACVIALRSWNVYPQKVERENISKLADDKFEHMPIGFEVAFPSLVDIAETFNINVPKNLPIMQKIYAQRDLKLSRIPKDIMHQVPTTLLYSLEGLSELDWKKLLKLQSEDGSFLTSPSSTAYALMKTKDENCLNYLSKIVQRFNGGVPTAYPVDMFEHSWAVDRLERLGISRYFKSEIKECMDYIYRYWTEKGICWARNSRVTDIDDTSMAFRLLRLHGYTVSQDVYRNFESNGEFFAFAGQLNQAVTGMLNLLRAAQVLYPEENLLEDAKKFSFEYLKGKQAKGQLIDKWIIIKDLPGEVEYALDLPWYASLPRLEACFYLNQYGGEDDVWIGKTLYRMPHVNNNIFLQLAKLDYAKCQTIHQLEWNHMKEWYEYSKLEKFGMSEEGLLLSYYLAASSLFEPELSNQRFAWAKTLTFVETIRSYFKSTDNLIDQRKAFVQDFINITYIYYADHGRYISVGKELTGRLVEMLKQLTLDTMVVHGIDIQHQLHRAWVTWLLIWQEEGDVDKAKAQLLEQTINTCAGRLSSEELMSQPLYKTLSNITNRLCHQLTTFQHQKVQNEDSYYVNTGGITTMEIESNMQELVRLVLCSSPDSLDPEFKQIFFMVARTFYYTAYCNPNTINGHINKVLFGSRM